jgi:hypothetical protein
MAQAEGKENFLLQGLVAGGSAALTAWALEKGYAFFQWRPPEPVFWFLIGVGAYAGVEALEYAQGERHLALTG